MALLLIPFNWIFQRTGKLGCSGSRPARPFKHILESIETASGFVPGATCLVKALAARVLLARHGYRTECRLGVARHSKTDKIYAHAWLEYQGAVVMGGEVSQYQALPLWGPAIKEGNES